MYVYRYELFRAYVQMEGLLFEYVILQSHNANKSKIIRSPYKMHLVLVYRDANPRFPISARKMVREPFKKCLTASNGEVNN
jgi:hypothetical protein